MFSKCLPISNRLTDLLREGQSRIDKSLDIVSLIKDIKYLKLLTMFKFDPDIETKFQIHHSRKNVIDLDKFDHG